MRCNWEKCVWGKLEESMIMIHLLQCLSEGPPWLGPRREIFDFEGGSIARNCPSRNKITCKYKF